MNDTKSLKTLYGVNTSAEKFGQIEKRDVRARTRFHRFESKEEAEAIFYEAYVKAYKKFMDVKKSFQKFQKDNDVQIDYFLDGDTHGLNHDMTINFTIDGFDFEMEMNGVHPIYDLNAMPGAEWTDGDEMNCGMPSP